MINRYFLILILAFMGVQKIKAQTPYFYYLEKKNNTGFDSLVAATHHEKVDTIKAINSYKIAATYFTRQDMPNYEKYLKQGFESSENPAYQDIGLYYQALINYTKADALNILQTEFPKIENRLKKYQSNEAKRIRIIMFQNLAMFKIMENNEVESMNILINKAVPLAKTIGDNELIAGLYKSIGVLFYNSKDFAKTVEYMNLAELYLNKMQKPTPQSKGIMGEVALMKAECLIRENRMPEAKTELDKVQKLIANYPESNFYSFYYSTLGYYQMKQENYDDANELLAKGLENAKKYNNNAISERIKLFQSELNTHLKNYHKSNEILNDIYENTDQERQKQEVLRELSKNYMQLKDTAKANLYAEKYVKSFDSLNAVSIHNNIATLEAKYNKAEREKQLAQSQLELSKKNKYMWILGLISLLLLAFVFLVFMNYKKNKKITEQREINLKQKLQQIQQKQELDVAKAILDGEERERERVAKDLHDGLGGMLAGVKINLSSWSSNHLDDHQNQSFNKIVNQLDQSVTELRRVARNLMPESLLNFGLEIALKDLCEFYMKENLQIDFQALNIQKNLPFNLQINIYRITQELISNAVKHSNATNIFVQCSQTDNQFFVTVEDNGTGLTHKDKQKAKSLGLKNLQNRVDYLKGKMEIFSEKNEGTSVNIELNIDAT